ncbi:hypothetical protein O9G_000192 [Rozella allomycis CSF55]|uniref:Uncharacterized protein n=1 Tax=Rozella allomycis (strain CSF55) TaxID=988480 RepID=A0A075AT74_ROZAC|nr:hypothetical protein O9G_000192 [Rozella allomycis CSF55]|eukprot:EPZ31713.1 hypothetical protein O9G_000192 [Rozella allomycis CSF55]
MELLANPGNNKLPVFCSNEKECFKLPLRNEVIWAEPKEDPINKLIMDKTKRSILTPKKESQTWFKLFKEYLISNPIIITTSEETFLKIDKNTSSYNQYVVWTIDTKEK